MIFHILSSLDKMFFQVLSDIHLERTKNLIPSIIKTKEILFLAGDIGSPFQTSYSEFLYQCSHQFQKIVLITGNHEYWNSTIKDTEGKIFSIVSKFNNIHFLNNSGIILNDRKIFGGTMWTQINRSCPSSDNKMIENFSFQTRNETNYQFKKTVIDTCPDIVISHHPPVRNVVHPNYLNYNLDLFTDNEPEMLERCCKYWVCGHLHHFSKHPKVIMNPHQKK